MTAWTDNEFPFGASEVNPGGAWGLFNVTAYGAVSGADSTAAFQAAINAAQTNGGGTVYAPAGNYKISSTLNITHSYVGLLGAGKNATILTATVTGMNLLAITSPSQPTGIAGCSVRGMGLWQNTLSAAGTGIALTYASLTILEDLQVSGFFTGVSIMRSANSLFKNVLTSFNPTVGTGLGSAVGWSLNGNTNVGDANGGNASCVFDNCACDMSSGGGYANRSVGGVGFKMFGTYVADYVFNTVNTSFCDYGISIDFTTAVPVAGGAGGTTGGGTNEDVLIINPIIDFYTNTGISINGVSAAPADNLSMVTVIGGWFDTVPGLSTSIGIYALNASGLSVTGTEFLGVMGPAPYVTAAYALGIQISSSSDFTISNCLFTSQKYGIYVLNSTDGVIHGNVFKNTQAGGSGWSGAGANHVLTGGTTSRLSVASNVFDGYLTGPAIYFAPTVSLCSAIGNTVNTAHIAAPYIQADSGSTGCRIKDNAGVNPVGNVTFAPGLTTVFTTNNTGYALDVYVSGGTVTNLQRKSNGTTVQVATSTTNIPIVHLEPGEAIAWTGSGAPTYTALGA